MRTELEVPRAQVGLLSSFFALPAHHPSPLVSCSCICLQGVHTAATKSHYLEITQQICKAAEAEAERRKVSLSLSYRVVPQASCLPVAALALQEGHGKRASEKLGDMDSDFDDEYEDEYGDGAGGRRRGRAHPMFDEVRLAAALPSQLACFRVLNG
jgi:hypothetical protein